MKKHVVFVFFAVSLIFFFSCKKKKGNETENNLDKSTSVRKPSAFLADSAYYFIKQQVKFGPRVPNTHAHQRCGNYIIQVLKKYKAEVTTQSFESKSFTQETLKLQNIIASFNLDKTKRILLAAHWDTRPFADKDKAKVTQPIEGANDGASGVAVLLEIARILRDHSSEFSIGIDLIFFDGEDYGPLHNQETNFDKSYWCLGSQYWSANKHKKEYSAYYGILLDMVGAKQATFFQEGFSKMYADEIVKKIWNTANRLGHSSYFINQESHGGVEDDHIYVNTIAKIPMVDIIDDFGSKEYHHTHLDKLDLIDKNTLHAVGETLLHVLINE